MTVVAADGMTADIWATALGVLGPEGLKQLPDSVEAMLMVGTEENHKVICTPGLRELLEEPLEK